MYYNIIYMHYTIYIIIYVRMYHEISLPHLPLQLFLQLPLQVRLSRRRKVCPTDVCTLLALCLLSLQHTWTQQCPTPKLHKIAVYLTHCITPPFHQIDLCVQQHLMFSEARAEHRSSLLHGPLTCQRLADKTMFLSSTIWCAMPLLTEKLLKAFKFLRAQRGPFL